MTTPPPPSDDRRADLRRALGGLPGADDPDAAAERVVEALDGYLGSSPSRAREEPVTDFAARERHEVHWALWLVLGSAVVATWVVAVALSGWPAALAVIAIWVAALIALVSS